MKLWKHHAAQPQADRINALAHARGEAWIGRYGGKISSEWEFAKALQLLEEDPEVYRRDRALDRGGRLDHLAAVRHETRNACTAGYKGIFQDGHYPSADFLARAQPGLRRLRRDQAGASAVRRSAAGPARSPPRPPRGPACPRASRSLSATSTRTSPRRPLRPSSQGQMVAIMGTSTCHVMNGDALAEVPGMCGVVDGGIVAGLFGYEAGQSGVGDIFAWCDRHRRAAKLPPRRPPSAASAARATDRAGRASSRSARTAWSRSTG